MDPSPCRKWSSVSGEHKDFQDLLQTQFGIDVHYFVDDADIWGTESLGPFFSDQFPKLEESLDSIHECVVGNEKKSRMMIDLYLNFVLKKGPTKKDIKIYLEKRFHNSICDYLIEYKDQCVLVIEAKGKLGRDQTSAKVNQDRVQLFEYMNNANVKCEMGILTDGVEWELFYQPRNSGCLYILREIDDSTAILNILTRCIYNESNVIDDFWAPNTHL